MFGFGGASVNETADDAVVLRVIAGPIGLLVLLGYLTLRRRPSSSPLLPAGLVDALGALPATVYFCLRAACALLPSRCSVSSRTTPPA